MLYPSFQDYLDGVYLLTYLHGRSAMRVVRDDVACTFGMAVGEKAVIMKSEDLQQAWSRASGRTLTDTTDVDMLAAWFHEKLLAVVHLAEAHSRWTLLTGGFGVAEA